MNTNGRETTRPRDLRGLFSPQSIAVVGASRTEGSVGHALFRNLLLGGYTGVLYPVNPKARSILGVKCYKSLTEIGEPVDLAVIIVPGRIVLKVLEECAACGVGNAIVISAGFKEVGGDGVKLERQLVAIARKHNINVLGPNCLGLVSMDPATLMNATFARDMPMPGNIGFISQSGALCCAILDYAKGAGIGFSQFISFGNKADVSEIDLLAYLGQDPLTQVILMYIEDLSDGPEFVRVAQGITHGPHAKPILAIKTGRTPQGAAAASSHTGSLAGSDEVYEAVFIQSGVLRVETIEDLFHYAQAFPNQPMPAGRRIGIVTNAGGPGIMATDACIRYGLELAKFRDYTEKSLRFQLPATASLRNPVDVIGDARHDRYQAALDAVCADENTDATVVIVTPQNMTDVTEIARVVVESAGFSKKPICACFMGLVDVSAGVDILRKGNVPHYSFPEDAMRAMAARCSFAQWARTPLKDFKTFDVDKNTVRRVFETERKAGRTRIIEVRALEVLRAYGVPTAPFELAATAEDAARAANDMGYPVVLKIASPKVLHKTESGGVKIKLADEAAVRAGFDEILANVKSKLGDDLEIWGILVQKMLPPAKEVILGVTRDAKFGPLIMFGLGGIYTEALRDVAFRLAPLRPNVADEMIRDIRSYRLLEGVRGERPSDVPAVAEALLRLSQLVTDWPEIQELDINPLMVFPSGDGAAAADGRIILAESAE
ncbi:MAG: acetate--CoA ligase family protein [Phycisphaerae bacterium]|nr:acetate--CoA ligase family protein [Phycisphaerae bacterium]